MKATRWQSADDAPSLCSTRGATHAASILFVSPLFLSSRYSLLFVFRCLYLQSPLVNIVLNHSLRLFTRNIKIPGHCQSSCTSSQLKKEVWWEVYVHFVKWRFIQFLWLLCAALRCAVSPRQLNFLYSKTGGELIALQLAATDQCSTCSIAGVWHGCACGIVPGRFRVNLSWRASDSPVAGHVGWPGQAGDELTAAPTSMELASCLALQQMRNAKRV